MTVYLVGTGPGDPGLLTARALEVIGQADVVLHDKLIPREALAAAPDGAELIDVGKVGGGPQVPQEETERLLVEHARAGRTVVRLKGGDPFVFGRGGEEARVLRAEGIDFEVVPGVTAGIAAPAYAGIPVTFRGAASAVAFVTGHEDPAKPETRDRLGRARVVPRDARLLHGRPRSCRGSPSSSSPTAARRTSRPRSCRRGRCPASARSRPRSRGSPRRPRASARPPITVVGPGRRAARRAGLVRAAPAERAQRRRHARPRAGERARRPAARARRRGRRGARHPHRAARGDAARHRRLRPARGHEPERRRAPARGGPRRARLAGPVDRRDRSRHRAGAARRRHRARRRPRARGRRGAGRGAPRRRPSAAPSIARAEEGRDVLPDALRDRGAEVDVLALYRTVAEPLDDGRARRRACAPTSPPSPPRRASATSSPRLAARSTGRASSRSARRRAPSCASTASSPTSRPRSTRPTASSTRSSRERRSAAAIGSPGHARQAASAEGRRVHAPGLVARRARGPGRGSSRTSRCASTGG